MKARIAYCRSIARNRPVLLLLCITMLFGFAFNLLAYTYIKDSFLLHQRLKKQSYSYVGISSFDRGAPNTYRYHGNYLLVSPTAPESLGWTYSYTDLINVVGIQELPATVYDDGGGQIFSGTVVSGEWGRLQRDEIAISQKVAEENGLSVGSTLYVSNGNSPLTFRVKYVYAEFYTLFDINVDRRCYSILLPAEAYIAYYGEEPQYLCYCNDSDNSFYMSIYLKSTELKSLAQGQSYFMLVGSLGIVVLQVVVFRLYARKTKGVKAKLHSYGWSKSAILSVQLFRIGIVFLPALVAFIGVCLWLEIPALFMGLAAGQCILSGLICLLTT